MSHEGGSELHPDATPEENARFVAFQAFLATEGLSPVTCACYASDWWNVAERMSRATGRPFSIDGITVEEFRAYRADAAARGVAAATSNRRLAFLRRYARFAAATTPACRALADGLAAESFDAVKPLGGRSALSREEEESLMQASARVGAAEHALVALLMRTGLRVEEIVGLRRGDVGGAPPTPTSLRIRGKREKTVLLPPMTSRAVGALLDSQPGEDSDLLLRSRGRYALGRAGVAAMISRCAREANVRASPRTLRHTFAVRYLAEHDDDVDGLSSALGRASPALLRAWRVEAGSPAAGARVVRWSADAPGRSTSDPEALGVRGSQLEAVRRTLAPGRRATLSARSTEQLIFVVSGRVELGSGATKIAAREGEVVIVPSGLPLSARALGSKTAVLVSTHAAPRPRP
jgi:site-specific recombinase XerD/quercetin dioxygenase-like cupin family protein